MTNFIFTNDVNTSLAGPVSSGATSLTVASSSGLPTSIPSGSVLVITLRDQATRLNTEIIYASSISGTTLSGLSRGQEGTTALSWTTGDYAYSGPTAGQMGSFTQLAQFPSDLATSGWKKYPDPNSPSGYFIEQFGNATMSGSSEVFNFPTAFPNGVFSVVVTESGAIAWTASNVSFYGVAATTNSSFTISHFVWNGTTIAAGTSGNIFWRAVGY